MDKMDKLETIRESVMKGGWTPEQAIVLVDSLLGLLERGSLPRRQKRSVLSIFQALVPILPPDSKPRLIPLFSRDCGDTLFMLSLYQSLVLPSDLDTLAKLVQAAARNLHFDPAEVPKFAVETTERKVMESRYKPGAVFVSRLAPSVELVQDYLGMAWAEKGRPPVFLLALYRDTLSKVDLDLFRTTILPTEQRLVRRSSSRLPDISATFDLLQLDLSSVAAELIFPSLLEHAFKPESSESALVLLKRIIEKSKDHTEVVRAFLQTRDQNEAQAAVLLTIISFLRADAQYNDAILDYCLDRSHRLRSDENKTGLLLCVSKFATRLTPKLVSYFEKEGAKAAFVNEFVKLGGVGPVGPLTGVSSMQMAVALSAGLPANVPANVRTFLNEGSSSFAGLTPSTAAEALCLSRTVLKGLEAFPNSPLLIKKFARLLLSWSGAREQLMTGWPQSLSVFDVTTAMVGALNEESCMDQFRQNYKRITRFLVSRIANDQDRVGLLRLFASSPIVSEDDPKRLRFFLKKCPHVLRHTDQRLLFESPWMGAILCLSGCYADFISQAESVLEISRFVSVEKIGKDFEKALHDPEFVELQTLDTMAKAVGKARGMTLTANTEIARVNGVLHCVVEKAVECAKYVLEVHTLCARMSLWSTTSSVQAELLTKVLFQALRLSQVPQLQAAVYSCVSEILKRVPLFQPVYFDVVKVLLAVQKDSWKEKSMKKIIRYISERVSLETVSPGEAFVFNHLLRATVYQNATNLRTSATHLLSRLVYERKFDSISLVIDLVIHLLETYSSQTVSTLFTTLTSLLTPSDWKPLLQASISLQQSSKTILLTNLLQYEEGIPERPWVEAPLWLLMNDESEEIYELALDVWHKFRLRLSARTVLTELPQYLFHENDEVQGVAARGLASAWGLHPQLARPLLDTLLNEFRCRTKHKQGLATLLDLLVPELRSYSLELIRFVIQEGVVGSTVEMRDRLIKLGVHLLKTHGKAMIEELFEVLERAIEGNDDNSKFAAVLLLGNLAQHFPSNDLKVSHTIDLLLKSLSSKQEAIYQPVAECLPGLIASRRDQGQTILADYMKVMFSPVPIANKRGSAYGLASIIKGLGIDSFVRLGVLEKFDDVINNKKSTIVERGSVLLALEGLSSVLRATFEPYLPEVVPFVLDCYSDSQLLTQAQITTKTMISGLSAHGVRSVLPLLTSGLEDSKWKSKIGAIEALGKMAFCAPRQLSECLPEVVPQVIKAFSDTHPEVFQAATRALADIGSVITNPEVSEVVPTLIKALSDASTLREALSVLLETNFRHYIDAPSLSILIPIVEGGLKSRLPEVKKMASQIVGGILALVPSTRSILPYISRLIQALKSALFDSIPEVRNVAAQNLGSLCKFIGLQQSKTIIEWLESIFFTETSAQVERSGAVHAYSEIIVRVSPNYWEQIIGRVIDMCRHPDPFTRVCFLGILIFLPDSTKGRFEDHLYEMLPAIFENLSHENDEVRSVAVRIMQIIIKGYCRKYLDKLLAPLEAGLFDSNYKTRQSCIILVGEMMEIIESMDRKEGRKEGTIPVNQKNKILSAVYILRSDHTGTIHTQAAKIWKALVENTPRVIPTLTSHVVERLLEIAESPRTETLNIVTAAIQNILEKYEDKLFQDYLNNFAKHYSSHPRGVAIAMREVCDCATRKMFNTYPEPVVRIVKQLLISEDPGLLASAGDIFAIIYEKVGAEGGKDFLMLLMQSVEGHPRAYRQLLKGKNQMVSKIIMPAIMKSQQKAQILREISDLVANELFNLIDFRGMFANMLKSIRESEDMLQAVMLIAASLTDYTALNLCLESLTGLESGKELVRILQEFANNSKLDFLSYVPRLFELVIPSIHSSDPDLLPLLAPTIASIIKPIQKEELYTLLPILTTTLAPCTEPLPAFAILKGLDPLIAIVQNSLLTGPAEYKEMAAKGYCDVVRLMNPKPLEAYVITLAGPLIRVLSERVHPNVRVGILDALQLLMQKGAAKLKTFTPQLRTIFIKSIQNPEESVREAGLRNLLDLLPMETRLDLVINELCSLKGDRDVVISSLQAVERISEKLTIPPQVSTSATNKLIGELEADIDSGVLAALGRLIAKLATHPPSVIQNLRAGPSAVVMLGYLLAELPEEQVAVAEWVYAQAVESCFESAISSMLVLSRSHQAASFSLAKKHFGKMSRNLYPCVLQLLLSFPSSLYFSDMESLKVLLSTLADLAAAVLGQTVRNSDLETTLKHILDLKTDAAASNIEKAAAVLSVSSQQTFRDYTHRLLS